MDSDTVEELERVRPKVPRYLFRAWNDTPGQGRRISGGYRGLNSPKATIPLAFRNGDDGGSVYDMPTGEFTKMVLGHVRNREECVTRFSSWSSSLTFVLHIAWKWLGANKSETARNHIHISIIDTKDLLDTNEIFWVPSLAFLDSILDDFEEEYLVHGVVSGPAHKAQPLKVFLDVKIDIDQLHERVYVHSGTTVAVSESSMQRARTVGDQYGGDFALPMALAVLCTAKRDTDLFRNGFGETLQLVSLRYSDLSVPAKWERDDSTQPDAEYVEGSADVEQFCRLMGALPKQRRVDSSRNEEMKGVVGKVHNET